MTPRIITEFGIELIRGGKSINQEIKPVNLSEKGLCVQVGAELVEGELLNVVVSLGSASDSIKATVKVVWRRYDKLSDIWYYGLGFVDLNDRQLKVILAYVEQGAAWLLEFMSEFPLFNDFSYEDCQNLLHIITLRFLPHQEVLYRAGEKDVDLHGLFIVQSGMVNIYKGPVPDHENQLAAVSTGQIFGESSLVCDQEHSATVAAVNDTYLIQLSKAGFNALKRKHPQVGLKVMEIVARTLSARLGRTTNMLFKPI